MSPYQSGSWYWKICWQILFASTALVVPFGLCLISFYWQSANAMHPPDIDGISKALHEN